MANYIQRVRANKQNRLVNSPHYATILKAYNELFSTTGGKVNGRQFFFDVIQPLMPDYAIRQWYVYLKRFKTAAGLEAARQIGKDITLPKIDAIEQQEVLENALLENARATAFGIQKALNLGNEALTQLSKEKDSSNPFLIKRLLPLVDLLFKAMRAQDSRINAIARIKQDSREEQKFQKAFDDAAFGGEEEKENE